MNLAPATPATAEPGRVEFARLLRFAAVGGGTTLGYAILAIGLNRIAGWSALPASLVAYGICAIGSYAAHRGFTFRSGRPHREAGWRFALTTTAGLIAALAVPGVLSSGLGLRPDISVLATCLLVPAMNYVLLERLVFRAPRDTGHRHGGSKD